MSGESIKQVDLASKVDRALVLGCGGLTGLAWEIGVTRGLSRFGIDLATSDRIIGTSAGAILAAHLAQGSDTSQIMHELTRLVGKQLRYDFSILHGLAVSQLFPDSPAAIRSLLPTARENARMPEDAWIAAVGELIPTKAWPENVLVAAMNASTGRLEVFGCRSGIPLSTAIAASCSIPGVMPPVRIGGHEFIDGAFRTTANADLARGASSCLVIAPRNMALISSRRPSMQVQRNLHDSALCIAPGIAELFLMGPNSLDLTWQTLITAAGELRGELASRAAAQVWCHRDETPEPV